MIEVKQSLFGINPMSQKVLSLEIGQLVLKCLR